MSIRRDLLLRSALFRRPEPLLVRPVAHAAPGPAAPAAESRCPRRAPERPARRRPAKA